MSNEDRSKVVGKKNMEIKFTYGKSVSLNNILHVLEMYRNLVSGDLLDANVRPWIRPLPVGIVLPVSKHAHSVAGRVHL